jgi:hypothetical protein
LKGQDAVVSTIATPALTQQVAVIEEAVKAGVKRFIPSEFGINTQKVEGGVKKILGGKLSLQEQLKRTAAEHKEFSWTGISTGIFFDWVCFLPLFYVDIMEVANHPSTQGLEHGFGYNLKEKTATVFDSGNEPFTATNLATIGKAIAAVLKHPEQTANKYIEVASFVTTQNEIVKNLEEGTGAKFTVEHQSAEETRKIADEKLAKGDFSSFRDYLTVYLYADGKGQSPKESELANKEIGLQQDDLKESIKAVLAKL